MKIFVIGDTHFNHEALATMFKTRPIDFESKIKKHWNNMISKDDIVIHLGDVMVGKHAEWDKIIPLLPGRKILCLGNHDNKPPLWYMKNGFDFCCTKFNFDMYGLNLLFSHEPVYYENFDLNIHGHIHLEEHRRYIYDEKHYLFSLEKTDYLPRSLDSIIKDWKKSL